jgi:hypothetical protein
MKLKSKIVLALMLINVFVLAAWKEATKKEVFINAVSCDSIPEMNKQIITYVNSKMNKKVDRGECWDLANQALKLVGAKWDGKYVYGNKVDPYTDCIYPGDIIQFEGVKAKKEVKGGQAIEKMGHHTAIIYAVKSKGVYVLAHQNTSAWGKKVGTSELDLKTIVKGRYMIYQPTK